MGHFNEILEGRFNRFVQKHFSMKGREGAPTLAADIGMTMQFNSGTENRYLEGWHLYSVSKNVPAVAAQLSMVQLRNPVGSGVVGVLTLASASGAAADGLAVYLSRSGVTTDLAGGILTTQGWDPRGPPASSIICSFGNAAAPAGSFQQVLSQLFAVNQTQVSPPGWEVPVLPGAAITLSSNGFNVTDFILGNWRERGMAPSELT